MEFVVCAQSTRNVAGARALLTPGADCEARRISQIKDSLFTGSDVILVGFDVYLMSRSEWHDIIFKLRLFTS